MSWTEIRTATKSKLEGITGVENVLDYVVWTDDWNFILSNFVTGDRVNTWMIGLVNNPDNRLNAGIVEHDYTLGIYAYYSIKTSLESSKTFENLIMTVRDAFMQSYNYVVGQTTTDSHMVTNPPINVRIENTVYLQQPCHRAVMEIPIEETEAHTYGES